MAGSLSNYLENIVIDHLLRNQAFTPPATVYIALYTVAPSDAGGGTEVTGGAYVRLALTLTAASAGASSNSGDHTFVTATANWGTIVAFAVLDAASAGNFLFWADLTTNKAVNNGDTAKFLSGDLDISVD